MKRTAGISAISLLALAACGAGATVQEQAGDAVASYVNDDDDLSDADFDTACLRRTALGLTDDVAQDVVDRDGQVDLDVDDDDRDDVYDFYNCADERDLARLIERESGADSGCLEASFDDSSPGDFLSEADGNSSDRLGDFDQVSTCATPVPEAPPATVPPATAPPTTPPPTTAPPTTAPPTTAPPTTPPPTTAPATTAPAPAMEEAPQPMSDPVGGVAGFGTDAEAFLNDDPVVADAVGGDVSSVFCFAPSNTNIGTEFLCFGAADNFGSIEFLIEITDVNAFLVTDARESLATDRILVFIVLDAAFATEEVSYDQPCARDFLAGLSDDEVSTIFDDTAEMNSISGLAPCIIL